MSVYKKAAVTYSKEIFTIKKYQKIAKIIYESEDKKTGREIYKSHVYPPEVPNTLVFFDE